jgi:hypothetical protein
MSSYPTAEQSAYKDVRVLCTETVEDELQRAHTTGLWEGYGHPEIVMVGMMPERAEEALSLICRAIAGGRRFETPAIVPGIYGPRPVAFVPVKADSASDMLGEGFAGRVMQVFVCDREGRFPWHGECDPIVRDAQTNAVEYVGEFPVTSYARAPRMH